MKKKFIKLPNITFELKLSPSAFFIYSNLMLNYMPGNAFNIQLNKIAERCNMCRATVCRAISELISKGLMLKKNNYIKIDGISRQIQNTYTLAKLDGRFTIIGANLLIKCRRTDKTTFMIYCYLKKCANQRGMSFPSLTSIQTATGLSRQTVISKLQVIQDNALLSKSHYIVQSGCFGHNNYIIIAVKTRTVLLALIVHYAKQLNNINEMFAVHKIHTISLFKVFYEFIGIVIWFLKSFFDLSSA